MKLRLVIIVLFAFLSVLAEAQNTSLQNVSNRKHLSLNGRWNYIIDPYEMGYYNYRRVPFDQTESGQGGFYDDRQQKNKGELIEYDFNLSPTLKVPGDWNSQSDRLELYEGTIWLRHRFSADPVPGKRYFLYFGAVNYEAHVYLNGKKLGSHKGGFTPFQFEVTDHLLAGGNTVVVKADNTRRQDEIPTVNTDWWNYGGITRDVLLVEVSDTYLSDYKVQLKKGSTAVVEASFKVEGKAKKQSVTLEIPDAGIRTTITADDNGVAAVDIPVKKLNLWSPEHPFLYDVRIILNQDTVADRIGFRTIETKGQDILLNGKSVFLRGISIHEENPLIPGRLRGQGDMRMLLQWAKELNCNYVRLAHYPHHEEMMRLADEMGLMVWAEVPVYWTISWTNPETYANAQQQLTDLIERDKNRASVIIWSIGNETPLSEPRHQFMQNLAAHVRKLDDTRLVGAALELHRKDKEMIIDDPLGDHLDLASFNEYAGWYFSDNEGMLSYHFNIKFNKPVIVTEFGGDALGGFHADENTRWSEEYQERLYINQLIMLNKIPGLRGMTPWILVDFRSPRRQHPYYQDFWNRKGLISETGKKKKAFHILKKFYDETELKYSEKNRK